MQTLVYGAGNVMTRLVTFLLLPLFTNVLSPEEYGLTTLLYVFLGDTATRTSAFQGIGIDSMTLCETTGDGGHPFLRWFIDRCRSGQTCGSAVSRRDLQLGIRCVVSACIRNGETR